MCKKKKNERIIKNDEGRKYDSTRDGRRGRKEEELDQKEKKAEKVKQHDKWELS
jgi:hypothetical protein